MIQVKASALKSKTSNEASEIRDLKNIIINLRKDIERKDNRNDLLTKDMMTLRTNVSNYEREIKLMSSTIDHLNIEKQKILNEMNKYKELYTKTNDQLSNYVGSSDVIKSLQLAKENNEILTKKLQESQDKLNQKNDYIVSLEDELQILKRTIQIQSQYNNNNKNDNQTDIIKSLYYELGKQQTKSHNLSIQCSNQFNEIEALRNKIEYYNNMKLDITNKLNTLTLSINQLNNELDNNKETIKVYTETNEKLQEENNNLQKQIESYNDIKEKYIELQENYNKTNKNYEVISLLNSNTELKYNELLTKYDIMNNQLNQFEKIIFQFENENKNLKSNENKLSNELTYLKELNDNLMKVSSDLTTKNNSLLIDNKQLDITNNNLLKHIKQIEFELNELKDKNIILTNERDEVIYGLKESIDKLKDISNKNEFLIKENNEMKEKLQALQQAKEHISVAVLDALYKERNKNRKLESVIQDIALSNRINDNIETENDSINLKDKDKESNHIIKETKIPVLKRRLSIGNSIGSFESPSDKSTTLEKLASMSPSDIPNSTPSDTSSEKKQIETSDESNDNKPKSVIIGELFRLRDTLQRIEDRTKSVNNTPYASNKFNYTNTEEENNINRDLFHN